MAEGGGLDAEDSIGELFGRLVEDGDELVRAEFGLQRELLARRIALARNGIILLICAAGVAFGALTALLVGLMIALTLWVTPLVAALVVAAVGLGVAFLLVRSAIRIIVPAFGASETIERGDG